MELTVIFSAIGVATTVAFATWLIRDKIDELRLEIKADRKELRAEFKQDIKDSETRTDAKIGLSDKIDQLHGVVK